ncbi:MAG: hypothetical protein ABIT83_10700 [Massilia sp.]
MLDLLADATSLEVVSDFLRKKGLHHSAGSWKDMREKRLIPYLNDSQISLVELVKLLSSAEESGDQHIFLFHCSAKDAEAIIERKAAEGRLRAGRMEHLIGGSDMNRMPETPTIVEVRWEAAAVDLSMVIKVAEVRTKRVLERERSLHGKFIKIYSDKQVRAVNVARLHRSGILELRIQSHDNTNKYDGDLNRFIRLINPLFSIAHFAETSLSTAKDKMWARRDELRDLIRYTDASVVDEKGNRVRAATGSDTSTLSDSAAGKSVDYMLREDANAYCSDSNIWFLKSDKLSNQVHVLLNGASNEFAIPRKCSAADYEYVFNQIRHFNR